MINVIIWLAATLAMFWSKNIPACIGAGFLVGAVVAAIRAGTRQQRLERLVTYYTEQYGEAPPGFSDKNTRVGGAIGAATGHNLAGGLIGAALDVWRQHSNERGMSDEQKALNRRIVGLQARSPWHGFAMLIGWLLLSAGVVWGVGQMGKY